MRTPALPPLSRPPARATAGFLLVLAVLGGAWLWLRDSRLVAVRTVTVSGASGADAPRVRAALEQAARSMTTLHLRGGQLRTAVQPFPAVVGVSAKADFPHGVRITVHEHTAVGVITSGATRLPIAADGKVLRGSTSTGLAVISTKVPPVTERVIDPVTQGLVRLLAAAPAPLRAQVTKAYRDHHGLSVRLSDGPALYFGGLTRLQAKWTAVARLLADRAAAGATYIDVRLPERPVAGGFPVAPTPQAAPVTPQTPHAVTPQPTPAPTTP